MVYKNQTFKQYLDTGVSLTSESYISVAMKYRKPNGVEGEWDVIIEDPAEAGIISYEIPAGVLDVIGTWYVWSYIVNSSGSFPGNQVPIMVNSEAIRITNADYIKSIVDIDSSVSDVKLNALITLAEEDYLRIRNAPWAQGYIEETGELYNQYPSGSDTTVAFMVEYMLQDMDDKELSSESTMNYSWTKRDKTIGGYPASITSSIKKFVRGI